MGPEQKCKERQSVPAGPERGREGTGSSDCPGRGYLGHQRTARASSPEGSPEGEGICFPIRETRVHGKELTVQELEHNSSAKVIAKMLKPNITDHDR